MRRATIRSGMRLSLLTETHIGTPVGLKRLFTEDFTRITSTGIMELKFQKHGCPRSNNTAADRYQGGPPREQFSRLNDKDRNPPINNSLREDRNAPINTNQGAIYCYAFSRHHRLMKTSSIAVETSRSTSM